MTGPTEQQPVAVPEGAIRSGEITLRWSWVESSVWTAQMRTALEQGVKGGKWFSLNDKICRAPTLAAALCKVAANQGAEGVDHVTIDDHQRWPNAFFVAQGLFCMKQAQALIRQSLTG